MSETVRVLHVDDEPEFADLTARFLEREDDRIGVITATSAEEGLDLLAERDVDCVVSDYDMPGRNGIEFLEAVRERDPDLPFVLFTGKGSEAVASDAVSAGVTDYLQKEGGTDQYAILANRIGNLVEGYRSRRALTERRRRLETLISNLPGMVYRCRNERGWPMEYVEGECEAITGHPPSALERGEVSFGTDLVHPEDRDDVWETVQDALDANDPFEITYRIVTDDGAERWVWERGRGVRYEGGEPGALEGFITDVTGRKERERKLEQYERIVEAMGDGVFVNDADGRHLEVNEQMTRLTGYDRETLLGEHPSLYLDEEDVAKGRRTVRRLLDDDGMEVGRYEETIHTADGDAVRCAVRQTLLPPENGEFRGSVGTVRDITEHRERERKIEGLHATARAIIEAETAEAVAEVVVEAASDVLDMPANAVHLHEGEGDGLVPVAWTDRGEELVGEVPTIRPGEGLAWEVYETGEAQVHDDVSTVPGRFNPDTEVRSEVIIPLDDHGVLLAGSDEPDAFDETDVSLGRTLAAHATTALDRIERAREIREERAFIDQALDTLDDVFYVVGPDGGMRRWNDRLPEVTGYADGEIDDMRAVDFFPEDERERIASAVEEVLASGHDTVEADLLTAAGDRVPYEFTGTRLTDRAGDLVGLVGIGRDVTDRREREEELARRESLFEAVLEASIDGILVVDEDREYVTWNQQFIDMWEVPEELIGDEPEEMGLEWALDRLERPDEFIDKVEYLYEHPEEESRDEVRLTDGRVFDRYSAPVEGDDGSHFGRVWFFRDITEREERKVELTRQNERLEEFTSIVSHDLRNPLNVAAGQLELAREECDSDCLEAVARALDRMEALIDDLLTLAREGREVSDVEPVDLADVVERCWGSVETAEATLVTRTDSVIRADRSRLRQLLENLMRNAVEHGGEGVTITVGDLDDGFYLEDDGVGIPAGERDEVFETGYSTADRGTGFGLNIVEGIAEAHDWTVSITEGEDGGARFEITGVEVEP